MASATGLIYDYLSPGEVESAVEIEREGYPVDEAGSLESFRFRQSNAGSLFLGAYIPGAGGSRQLIGYVCSTLSPDEILTHESMSNHVPGSQSVCIHSVCVAKPYRRSGVGLKLLKEYLARLLSSPGAPYKRVLLITHEELRTFYEKAGFTWVGKSKVTHGSRPWYDMKIVLGDQGQQTAQTASHTVEDSTGAQIQVPADVLQSLLRPSSEKHTPTFVTEYRHGLDDLMIQDEDTGSAINKYDLLCPRGCKSIILKTGCAQWTERTSVAMEPEDARHSLLAPLPPPPETAQWWLVKPSPMAFENIGFSRPAGTLSTGKRIKLLVCAECDLGPLGWCEEGGTEFWLAASRVGYRKL